MKLYFLHVRHSSAVSLCDSHDTVHSMTDKIGEKIYEEVKESEVKEIL